MPLRILPSLAGTLFALLVILGSVAGLSINKAKTQGFEPGAPTLTAPSSQTPGAAARGYEPILARDGE